MTASYKNVKYKLTGTYEVIKIAGFRRPKTKPRNHRLYKK